MNYLELYDFPGIYLMRNTVEGKVYIGRSVNIARRMAGHKSISDGCSRLREAIERCGWDAFEVFVLERVEDQTLMSVREDYWIKRYDSTNEEKGYNVVPGGIRTAPHRKPRGGGEKRRDEEESEPMSDGERRHRLGQAYGILLELASRRRQRLAQQQDDAARRAEQQKQQEGDA